MRRQHSSRTDRDRDAGRARELPLAHLPAAWWLGLAAVLLAASPAADAARQERSGAEVVASVCAVSCHGTGEQGAPRIGDERAWAPRAAQGLSALSAHALQGIRNMPAHGGDMSLSDIEIERAIVVMVNRSGGRWATPLDASSPAVVRRGGAIVAAHCALCHQDGREGAPRIGDRAAWAPRVSQGLDALVRSATHGHGGMPPRGGVADLSDLELRGAIVHMFNAGVALPTPAPQVATAPDPFHKTIDGADVYLGVMRASAMAPGPVRSAAPSGKDVHYVNISLIDARTRDPVQGAQIQLRVADLMGSETRMLEPIAANNAVSYGAYFSMPGPYPYAITAQIRRPGVAGEAEVKFEFRTR